MPSERQVKRVELGLAIYATLLSTVLGVREFRDYRNERPILRAECNESDIEFVGQPDEPAKLTFSVRLWNAGRRPVTIHKAQTRFSFRTLDLAPSVWTSLPNDFKAPQFLLKLDEGDLVVFSQTMALTRIERPLKEGIMYSGECLIKLSSTNGEEELKHPVRFTYSYEVIEPP